MEELKIEATKSSPAVMFEPKKNLVVIKGYSYPQNAASFYKPVIYWLESFLENSIEPLTVNIDLIFLNTSSSKFIFSILDLLERTFKKGRKIVINWFYNTDNEVALECGEYFKEDRTLPFNILNIEEDEN